VTQYATSADFRKFGGLTSRVIDSIDAPKLNEALADASLFFDGYAKSHFGVPLTTPSIDVKIRVCWVAAWMLVTSEFGFNPENPADQTVIKNYDSAVRWLEQVSKGAIVPVDTGDQTPTTLENAPEVYSSEASRGW
jgi:phage gp36-like protein